MICDNFLKEKFGKWIVLINIDIGIDKPCLYFRDNAVRGFEDRDIRFYAKHMVILERKNA